MSLEAEETNKFADGIILEFENPSHQGFNEETNLWFPVPSIEGGTRTIGFGHKLTDKEEMSGQVFVGGNFQDISEGLSSSQISQLYEEDKRTVIEGLKNILPENVQRSLNPQQTGSLISLVFNTGLTSFRNSRAYQNLIEGDIEGFMFESFDDTRGFVRVNNKINEGLQRRRSMEAQLFSVNTAPIENSEVKKLNNITIRENTPNESPLVKPFRTFDNFN